MVLSFQGSLDRWPLHFHTLPPANLPAWLLASQKSTERKERVAFYDSIGLLDASQHTTFLSTYVQLLSLL